MSDAEKDAIIGRAVREEKELRQELGLRHKVLADIAKGLEDLRNGINKRISLFQPCRDEITLPVDLAKYPNFDSIVVVINDAMAIHEKLLEAEKYLVRLGVRDSPIQ